MNHSVVTVSCFVLLGCSVTVQEVSSGSVGGTGGGSSTTGNGGEMFGSSSSDGSGGEPFDAAPPNGSCAGLTLVYPHHPSDPPGTQVELLPPVGCNLVSVTADLSVVDHTSMPPGLPRIIVGMSSDGMVTENVIGVAQDGSKNTGEYNAQHTIDVSIQDVIVTASRTYYGIGVFESGTGSVSGDHFYNWTCRCK